MWFLLRLCFCIYTGSGEVFMKMMKVGKDGAKLRSVIFLVLLLVVISLASLFFLGKSIVLSTINSDLAELYENVPVDASDIAAFDLDRQILPVYESSIVYRYAYVAEVFEPDPTQQLKIGVDSSIDSLRFGKLLLGTVSTKTINLENLDEKCFLVNVVVQGNGSDHIELDEEHVSFYMDQGMKSDIPVKFNATESGTFSGEVDIVILKLSRFGLVLYPLLK